MLKYYCIVGIDEVLDMNNKKNFNKKSLAFTLAEVVVVMAILGVMMAAFAPVITKRSVSNATNNFRKFGPTNGHTGIYYGTTSDTKKVLIGDTEVRHSISDYNPKLIITSSKNDSNIVNPQISFAYDDTNIDPINAGFLFISPNNSNPEKGTLILGGPIRNNSNNALSTYTQHLDKGYLDLHSITALGVNACAAELGTRGSIPLNTVCIGAQTGRQYMAGNINQPEIFIGNSRTAYNVNNIFFGDTPLNNFIQYDASDIRLKNVGKEFTGGLDELNKLTIYNYTYKRDADKEPKVGVMAQDLQKVFPNAVKENKDGYLYIRKDDMLYATINAVKELFQKITTNHEKIKALEERNAMLEQQNKELQNLYIELSQRIEKLDKKKTRGKLTIIPTEVDEIDNNVENENK